MLLAATVWTVGGVEFELVVKESTVPAPQVLLELFWA
jgi:hypothetical protein